MEEEQHKDMPNMLGICRAMRVQRGEMPASEASVADIAHWMLADPQLPIDSACSNYIRGYKDALRILVDYADKAISGNSASKLDKLLGRH